MIDIAVAMAVGASACAGLLLALSRDLMRTVIGLAVLGSAANLFVFGAGRLNVGKPPLVPAGISAPIGPVANPLPQALVLTAIVIGFALACFGVALALEIQRETGKSDSDALRFAEPPPRSTGDPGELP